MYRIFTVCTDYVQIMYRLYTNIYTFYISCRNPKDVLVLRHVIQSLIFLEGLEGVLCQGRHLFKRPPLGVAGHELGDVRVELLSEAEG